MSDFFTVLDEYLGDATDTTDIRVTVRRCWFYDFEGYPIRLWNGQGKLFTTGNVEWLGTLDANGNNVHKTPSISDGRDGTSATYNFSLNIIDLPGEPAMKSYDALKAEQWRVRKRKLTCYLAIFKQGEGLRPETPITFFKELEMFSPKFSEKIDIGAGGVMLKKYVVSISAKDGNSGRSNVPSGTYADSVQKERARQLGVSLDRGSEFLAKLANRTYVIE